MPWVDYEKATPNQQVDFRRVNKRLDPNWKDYKIWITKGGEASLRVGHWQWTDKYAAETTAAMKQSMRGEDVRSRGDLRDFKAGDLHLNREKA